MSDGSPSTFTLIKCAEFYIWVIVFLILLVTLGIDWAVSIAVLLMAMYCWLPKFWESHFFCFVSDESNKKAKITPPLISLLLKLHQRRIVVIERAKHLAYTWMKPAWRLILAIVLFLIFYIVVLDAVLLSMSELLGSVFHKVAIMLYPLYTSLFLPEGDKSFFPLTVTIVQTMPPTSYIPAIAKLSGVAIPLQFTSFFFYCREMRAISESSMIRNRDRTFFLSAVLSLVLTAGLGAILQLYLGNDAYYASKYAQAMTHLVVLLFVLSLCLVVKTSMVLIHLNLPLQLAIKGDDIEKLLIKLITMPVKDCKDCQHCKDFKDRKNHKYCGSCPDREDCHSHKDCGHCNDCKTRDACRLNKFLRTDVFDKLNCVTESYYQIRTTMTEKNMESNYIESFRRWGKVLQTVMNKRVNVEGNFYNVFGYFAQHDTGEFLSYYRCILRNQMSLISTLHKNGKFEAALLEIRLLFLFRPSNKRSGTLLFEGIKAQTEKNSPSYRFIDEYLVALFDITKRLYEIDDAMLRILNDRQNQLQFWKSVHPQYVFVYYRAIIMDLVEKDDLQGLTEQAYNFRKAINNSLSKTGEKKNNSNKMHTAIASKARVQEMVNEEIAGIKAKLHGDLLDTRKSMEDDVWVEVLSILVQATAKAIELSHLQCVGFLVKNIVSNGPSNRLEKALERICNDGHHMQYRIPFRLEKMIGVQFNLNEHTHGYICNKLKFLIYCQQKYMIMFPIGGNAQIPNAPIVLNFNNKDGAIQFLFDKITIAGEKYNLTWIHNQDFRKKIMEEFTPLEKTDDVFVHPI